MSTIIIAGMHRSGTSLTASLCQSAGIDIGKNLVGAKNGNEFGHFENKDFVHFHDNILQKLGYSWCNIPEDQSIIKCAFGLEKSNAKKLIAKNSSKNWGWKDPRNSLFFPHYIDLVNDPKIIICWRNPYSIAKSLSKRNNFEIEFGLSLCNDYFEYLYKNIQKVKYPILHIEFEQYFIQPEKICKNLESFLECSSKINVNLIQMKNIQA